MVQRYWSLYSSQFDGLAYSTQKWPDVGLLFINIGGIPTANRIELLLKKMLCSVETQSQQDLVRARTRSILHGVHATSYCNCPWMATFWMHIILELGLIIFRLGPMKYRYQSLRKSLKRCSGISFPPLPWLAREKNPCRNRTFFAKTPFCIIGMPSFIWSFAM